MGTNTGTVMTIANSIIGVSVLAMPFCFKECGIFLSILMLILSSVLSRLTCFLVLKAAVMSRRRNFEFLAFHVFGTTGKFLVELCIIGFLMGTCIAFFVVVGDLGPAILAKTLNIANTSSLRPSVLIGLAFLVVLPLGLLRNVDSLSSICAASIGFYVCLVLKVIAEALPHLRSGIWIDKVEYWKPDGILQCLPIFSMALFCQTQLFEIYETMPNASLERMNGAVRSAINICTGVYISVGFFGYVAFCTESFSGNILMSFSPSLMSDVIKLGFVLSVAVSFPLVIFPCRASLYSLLFRRIQVPHHEVASSHMPESRFKCITLFVVSVSLAIGLMIPNIELVLGLVGSTIGVAICVIFPAAAFTLVSTKESAERVAARVLIFVGVLILVLGTYATLFADNRDPPIPHVPDLPNEPQLPDGLVKTLDRGTIEIVPPVAVMNGVSQDVPKVPAALDVVSEVVPAAIPKDSAEVRREPPVPIEPIDDAAKETKELKTKEIKKPTPDLTKPPKESPLVERRLEETATTKSRDVKDRTNNEQVIDKDAIRKEDEELAEAEKLSKEDTDKKNDQLLKKLEKHKEEQHKLLEEQRQILHELKEQKKESDKEREDEKEKEEKEGKVPAAQESEPEGGNKARPPKKREEESRKQEQEVIPKDREDVANPDSLKTPEFGYAARPDKPLPPKQPIAYEQRFSSKDEKAKPIDVPANIAEKSPVVEPIKEKKQANVPNPQMPSIKSLLIPSLPPDSPDSKRNRDVVDQEIKHQAKAFKLEKPVVGLNKIQPDKIQPDKIQPHAMVDGPSNHEIDKVKNLEILRANVEAVEAKAMRRDILGTGGGGEESREAPGEREKRDTVGEAPEIEAPPSANKTHKGEPKDGEIGGDCESKDGPIEIRSSEPAAIKTSSRLSDPPVQSVVLDALENELSDNGVKPMPRDLKSVRLEPTDDQRESGDRKTVSKKQEV